MIVLSLLSLFSEIKHSYSYSYSDSLQALILLNPNNHYIHGFHNIFDYRDFIYSDFIYSDYLLCTRVGVKYSTCTWYLYLSTSTYLSVLDVLEYLVYENAKVLVLVLVLDQKVLGTYK